MLFTWANLVKQNESASRYKNMYSHSYGDRSPLTSSTQSEDNLIQWVDESDKYSHPLNKWLGFHS